MHTQVCRAAMAFFWKARPPLSVPITDVPPGTFKFLKFRQDYGLVGLIYFSWRPWICGKFFSHYKTIAKAIDFLDFFLKIINRDLFEVHS
jgi:hypothetical protein